MAFWAAFRWAGLAGLAVRSVSFFRGPRLFTGRVVGDLVEIGCFPIGSSLQWVPEQYYGASKLRRFAIVLIAPALGFMIAAALLGPSTALHHIGRGLIQIPMGALHPLTIGVELIARLQMVFARSPEAFIGILMAKGLADDLLPIGGSVLTNGILALRRSAPEGHRVIEQILTLNALTAMAILGSWFVALVAYALTTHP